MIPAEPTKRWALVPGPSRDSALFYHVDARGADVNEMWSAVSHCVSNLVWVCDHYVVTPSPLYLTGSPIMEENWKRVLEVLVAYYEQDKANIARVEALIELLPITRDGIPERENCEA